MSDIKDKEDESKWNVRLNCKFEGSRRCHRCSQPRRRIANGTECTCRPFGIWIPSRCTPSNLLGQKKNTQDATPTAISNHTQLTNQTQQQIMLIYPPRGRACRQLAWHPYWTTSHDTPALVRFLELAGGFLGSFSLLRSRVYLEERFSLPSFEQRCHSPTPSQKINYFLWANEMIEMFHPLPNKL